MKFTQNYVRIATGLMFALAVYIISKSIFFGVLAAVAVTATLYAPDAAFNSIKEASLRKPKVLSTWYLCMDLIPASIPILFFIIYGNPILTFMAVLFFVVDMYVTMHIRYSHFYQRAQAIIILDYKRKRSEAEEKAKGTENVASKPAKKKNPLATIFEFIKDDVLRKAKEDKAPPVEEPDVTIELKLRDSKPEAKPEAKPKAKPAEKAAPKPEAKPAVKPEAKPAKTVAKKKATEKKVEAPKTFEAFQKEIKGLGKKEFLEYCKKAFPALGISKSMKTETVLTYIESFYGVKEVTS